MLKWDVLPGFLYLIYVMNIHNGLFYIIFKSNHKF